jgi:Domain of unknown function (DUF6430)
VKRGALSRRRPAAAWRIMQPFVLNALLAFGGVSALVEFIGELYPPTLRRPGIIGAGTVVLCLGWAAWRNKPIREVFHYFQHPAITLRILAEDLFEQQAHLVVGFSDTFDTALTGARLISPASVQGQLLQRLYSGMPLPWTARSRRHCTACSRSLGNWTREAPGGSVSLDKARRYQGFCGVAMGGQIVESVMGSAAPLPTVTGHRAERLNRR